MESQVLSPDQSRSQVPTPKLQRPEQYKKNLAQAGRRPGVWNRESKY
jgi:hypothetical protein